MTCTEPQCTLHPDHEVPHKAQDGRQWSTPIMELARTLREPKSDTTGTLVPDASVMALGSNGRIPLRYTVLGVGMASGGKVYALVEVSVNG